LINLVRYKLIVLLVAIFSITFQSKILKAGNFSCGLGGQGACLDYGDTICSSRGKCVSDDAICYNKNTCGFGFDNGMVCKKDFNELVEEYNELLNNYRTLSNNFDSTANNYKSLLNQYNDLVESFNDMRQLAIDRQYKLNNRESCVQNAATTADAKNCSLSF